jgi:hypothetical protein
MDEYSLKTLACSTRAGLLKFVDKFKRLDIR